MLEIRRDGYHSALFLRIEEVCDMERLLEKTFRLFTESVENGTAICALKNMCRLPSANMMDWSDERMLMLYKLRYGYALAWEYYNMTENTLRHYMEHAQGEEREHKAITMQCASEHQELLTAVLNHMRRENRVPGVYDCRIQEKSDGKGAADICFFSCEFSRDVLNNKESGAYAAFTGHSAGAVLEAARMSGCGHLIYQSEESTKKIPWECPEKIKEYLWRLNEYCINYKNGHNCFGVCARQLDIMPTLTTGEIFSQVYYNEDREEV